MKFLKIIILFFCPLILFAQKSIEITSTQQRFAIVDFAEYLIDANGRFSIENIAVKKFKAFNGSIINFGDNSAYLWLRFSILNNENSTQEFSFITKGVDSLWCYQMDGLNSKILKSTLTGSHYNFTKREYPNANLTFTFSLKPSQSSNIYLRIRNVNYPLSVYPALVMSNEQAKIFLKRSDLYQSIYIGIMLFLLLFGTALFLFFKEKLYFFYLLCVFFSMSMMLVYNDYYYLIFDKIPNIIRNKNFYGIPTTVVPMFYLFFAKEFLVFKYNYNKSIDTFTYIISFATVLVVLVFLTANISFYRYRYFIYLFIFGLCTLTIFLLYLSLSSKYKPAWVFLSATVPVLSIGILETLSEFHHIPVQLMHMIYYSSTVLEMFLLTLGLAYKFKISQDEKKKLQTEIFAIESQAQETERQRIAQDLHDKLGGLMATIKINLLTFIKANPIKEDNVLPRNIELLDMASEEVRNIAHALASSTLTKLGLVALLREIYQDSDNPRVIIQNTGFDTRLDNAREMAMYAIIQEAVKNAIKHGEAKEISISFKQNEDKLVVIIEDDGKGFDTNLTNIKGRGLANINFRVKEHLDGELSIESSRDNGVIILIKFVI